jgi:hypothetical protein
MHSKIFFIGKRHRAGLLVQRPTPNLDDQAFVFMTPGDRVAQLYPQALDTHFSRLLRHARVTVGLLFNLGHHTGIPLNNTDKQEMQIFLEYSEIYRLFGTSEEVIYNKREAKTRILKLYLLKPFISSSL